MNLENGMYISAVVEAFELSEWAPGKYNQILVLNTPYQDRYGKETAKYHRINIHSNDVQQVQEFANQHKGIKVLCPVGVNLKSGVSNRNNQPYAFNDFYKPKGAEIKVQTSKAG